MDSAQFKWIAVVILNYVCKLLACTITAAAPLH